MAHYGSFKPDTHLQGMSSPQPFAVHLGLPESSTFQLLGPFPNGSSSYWIVEVNGAIMGIQGPLGHPIRLAANPFSPSLPSHTLPPPATHWSSHPCSSPRPSDIYLVMRSLDSKILKAAAPLVDDEGTHWALEVDGTHWHIRPAGKANVFNPKKLALADKNIPEEELLPQEIDRSPRGDVYYHRRRKIGETYRKPHEIRDICHRILDECRMLKIGYNLANFNCRHFVIKLWSQIALNPGYSQHARLTYDANSTLLHEIQGMARGIVEDVKDEVRGKVLRLLSRVL
ncbi:hypothetical protein CC2G_007080 [Coprinopsis cinerea AmutBmut pab1-1]|nr:hypothetical protein CC2G_007080 [Coprinopsis cinerea AmutBmut pab1-1]